MGMILRIASSRIVGQGDIVGRSGYFSLNLSANSVMRGRLDARRTLKSLVADLRKKWSLTTISNTGQRNRCNTKIGSYVMLRYPLNNIRVFLQQFFVSLLWRILDTGQKQVLVKAEPFYNFLFI